MYSHLNCSQKVNTNKLSLESESGHVNRCRRFLPPKVRDIAPTSFPVSTLFFNVGNEVEDVCQYLDFYWLSSHRLDQESSFFACPYSCTVRFNGPALCKRHKVSYRVPLSQRTSFATVWLASLSHLFKGWIVLSSGD